MHTLLLEEYAVSKKWVIIIDWQETGQKCDFVFIRSMRTFTIGSLLCQVFRKMCEETARKRRRIKTCLIVLVFMLRAMTYIDSYELFWYWIGVVQFVSHKVWSDKGFVIWHSHHCCFLQFVSLWSLSMSIAIIFKTNYKLSETLELNATQKRFQVFMKEMRCRQNLWQKMHHRQDV